MDANITETHSIVVELVPYKDAFGILKYRPSGRIRSITGGGLWFNAPKSLILQIMGAPNGS